MHPETARYEGPVLACAKRAKLAMVVLGMMGVVLVIMAAVQSWGIVLVTNIGADGLTGDSQAQLALFEQLTRWTGIAEVVLMVVTGVAFLRWVHLLVKVTRYLGGHALPWTPSRAVWGFIIPFISLIRPYQVMRDVNRAIDPECIAEPPPRADPAAQRDYRTAAYVAVPPPKALPTSVIGLWWVSFIAMGLLSNAAQRAFSPGDTLETLLTSFGIAVTSSIVGAASAALAIQVVRSTTARLEERLRRIRFSTPEELDAQGIELD